MKHAGDLLITSDGHRHLQDYDLREIDSCVPRCVFRLKYQARLSRVLQAVRGACSPGDRVLEVGSAQANLSLLLAESGYTAVALDLRPEALTYARAKHERGRFLAVAGSAEALPLAADSFGCVMLPELLEHCARPVEILSEALRVLRPGGYLVVTTLNGEYPGADEPAYHADGAASPANLERQFGPDAPDHLFAFSRTSLRELLRETGVEVLRCEYVGSALLANRLNPLKRLLPTGAILGLSALLNRAPLLGRRYSLNLFALARKASGP